MRCNSKISENLRREPHFIRASIVTNTISVPEVNDKIHETLVLAMDHDAAMTRKSFAPLKKTPVKVSKILKQTTYYHSIISQYWA